MPRYAAQIGSTLTGLRRTHAADLGNVGHKELEEAYRKETAAHKETKDLLNMIRVIAIVLFVLLVGSVLVWWSVLR